MNALLRSIRSIALMVFLVVLTRRMAARGHQFFPDGAAVLPNLYGTWNTGWPGKRPGQPGSRCPALSGCQDSSGVVQSCGLSSTAKLHLRNFHGLFSSGKRVF